MAQNQCDFTWKGGETSSLGERELERKARLDSKISILLLKEKERLGIHIKTILENDTHKKSRCTVVVVS